MDHLGFILATYLVAFGASAALAWRTLRRGHELAQRLPDEDKPWT
jgi:hypothetical protein